VKIKVAAGVPRMCRTQTGCDVIVLDLPGVRAGMRCKRLINKPLESPLAD
jgi:hypothetical protein